MFFAAERAPCQQMASAHRLSKKPWKISGKTGLDPGWRLDYCPRLMSGDQASLAKKNHRKSTWLGLHRGASLKSVFCGPRSESVGKEAGRTLRIYFQHRCENLWHRCGIRSFQSLPENFGVLSPPGMLFFRGLFLVWDLAICQAENEAMIQVCA